MKYLILNYLKNNKKNQHIYLLLFLLYVFICAFFTIYFYYEYKLNITIDEKMYIEAVVENKEVLNNKIVSDKECSEYNITYCKIKVNRYNKDEILYYLDKENIHYTFSDEVEKIEEFNNIKNILLVVVITFGILGYILSINLLNKKLHTEKDFKYILNSLGYTKRKLILFDYLLLIPIYTLYFISSSLCIFLFSELTNNSAFYQIYAISISVTQIVVIIISLITYYILMRLNNKKE